MPADTAKETKAEKAAKAAESPEVKWDRTQRERAEAARDAANKESERRAGMTTAELAADDRKVQHAAQTEADRWNALTQEEQNKELADPKSKHYEPLPPWQTRLPSGRIFDARAQAQLSFSATNGTAISEGDDLQVARDFYFESLNSEAPEK